MKKAKKLKDSTTDFMKMGMTGMVGLGAMGAIGSLPGMPAEAQNVQKMAGVGVTLGMTGGLLNIAQDTFSFDKKKKRK